MRNSTFNDKSICLSYEWIAIYINQSQIERVPIEIDELGEGWVELEIYWLRAINIRFKI